MAQVHAIEVTVDVIVQVRRTITIAAATAEEATELVKPMALAKFESEHPDVCKSASSIETKVVDVMG